MNPMDALLEQKRRDVEKRKRVSAGEEPFGAVAAENRLVSWKKSHFRLIAEVKRASLSAGPIRSETDLSALASAYERAGTSAISVLTEEHYFHGSLNDLSKIRDSVSVPLLQKDFLIDEFQIREAKAYGASFVLLIAKFITKQELESFLKLCRDLQINAIVEITNERDLEKITTPVDFLGVNSRDLETLQIDIDRFRSLRNVLPDAFLIAESGINNLKTLSEIRDLQYHGALIGEHFLRAENPAAEVKKFVSYIGALPEGPRPVGPKIKICGITSEHDAMLSIESGADALGFIFADSPRRVDPQKLRQFRFKIPRHILCVGVFRGQPKETILQIRKDFQLDIVQVYEPLEINGSVWNACLAADRSQIEVIRTTRTSNSTLWDLKAEENQLPDLWRELGREKIFGLAGGLTPETVGVAVSLCHPEWIDVARGVESRPGVKDKNKLYAFMKEVTQ